MRVLTSFACISGKVIHLSVLCTYSKGLLVEWIVLANEFPTFTNYMWKALAMTLLSDIIILIIYKNIYISYLTSVVFFSDNILK